MPGVTGGRVAKPFWAGSSHQLRGAARVTIRAPLVERNARRLRVLVSIAFMILSSRLLGGTFDRPKGRIVGAAATNEVGQRLSNLIVARSRIASQQFDSRHDPAIDTIAALIHLFLDPSSLDRVRISGVPSPASVVISRFVTAETGVTQDRTA